MKNDIYLRDVRIHEPAAPAFHLGKQKIGIFCMLSRCRAFQSFSRFSAMKRLNSLFLLHHLMLFLRGSKKSWNIASHPAAMVL
jgi:hypothetical protein